MRRIETNLTDIIAGAAPWLAPIPTAYLVGRSAIQYLGWPVPVAIVAAAIVESLGLSAVNTALELREYNQAKRKTDPGAPFSLAAVLVVVYVAVAIVLTVALDVVPTLARYAPAIFPALSLAGVTILALRSDHRRRLAAIEAEKAERRALRQEQRQLTVKKASSSVKRQAMRKASSVNVDTLLTLYQADPLTTPTQAAGALGVSRQTIYNQLQALETSGRIRRNGHGVEILTED